MTSERHSEQPHAHHLQLGCGCEILMTPMGDLFISMAEDHEGCLAARLADNEILEDLLATLTDDAGPEDVLDLLRRKYGASATDIEVPLEILSNGLARAVSNGEVQRSADLTEIAINRGVWFTVAEWGERVCDPVAGENGVPILLRHYLLADRQHIGTWVVGPDEEIQIDNPALQAVVDVILKRYKEPDDEDYDFNGEWYCCQLVQPPWPVSEHHSREGAERAARRRTEIDPLCSYCALSRDEVAQAMLTPRPAASVSAESASDWQTNNE